MRIKESKRKELLEDPGSIRSILHTFVMYPVMIFVAAILFALAIYSDIKGSNNFLFCCQALLIGIIIGLIIAILQAIERPGIYIGKVLLIWFLWSMSCFVMVDLKSISANREIVIQFITSSEFIFLACLLPDFMVEINKIRIQNKKKDADAIEEVDKQLD